MSATLEASGTYEKWNTTPNITVQHCPWVPSRLGVLPLGHHVSLLIESLLKSDSQQLEFGVQPFRQFFRFTKATDLNVRRFLVPAASDIPRMDPGSQFSDHPWIRERLKPTGDQSGSSATVHSSEQ